MENENTVDSTVERINEIVKTIDANRRKEFLKDLEEEILQTNNLELFYKLCSEISEVDETAYAEAVIKSKDAKYNYLFATISSDKMLEHGQVIIESKDQKYNYLFFKELLWNSVLHLIPPYRGIVYRKRKKAHINAILDSKDPEYNYYCALESNDLETDRRKHLNVLIESKDPRYNYLAADTIRNINIEPHEKVVIESKNLEYNYRFVRDVKGAKISEHKQVILEAQTRSYISENDKKYIDLFIEDYGSDDYSAATEKVKTLIKDLDIKKLKENNETV